MRVAVTGASGFLGRYVCQALFENGVDFVPFHHSNPVSFNHGAIQSKKLDLANIPANLFAFLGKPDVLLHLAWSGLPNYRSPNHVDCELPKQFEFMKRAIEDGVPSSLITGTCFEYGMQSGALAEDTELKPDNPYGKAKAELLHRLTDLKQSHPFKLTWARLFYMYGDGQAPTSLWSQFRDAVSQNKPSFPMSGGQQVRDFLPVKDVARSLVALTVLNQDIGVINVCSGIPQKVEDLVRSWASDANWDGILELGHYPYPDYEPFSFWGCAGKLKALVNN